MLKDFVLAGVVELLVISKIVALSNGSGPGLDRRGEMPFFPSGKFETMKP